MMERLSFVLLVLLAGCALQSRPQTGDRPVVVGTITEQQSHATALLQAVSAVDDSVVWVSGHQATWVRTVDGGRTWVPGAMTGPDSALEFRDVEAGGTPPADPLAGRPRGPSRTFQTPRPGGGCGRRFLNPDAAPLVARFRLWG